MTACEWSGVCQGVGAGPQARCGKGRLRWARASCTHAVLQLLMLPNGPAATAEEQVRLSKGKTVCLHMSMGTQHMH